MGRQLQSRESAERPRPGRFDRSGENVGDRPLDLPEGKVGSAYLKYRNFA